MKKTIVTSLAVMLIFISCSEGVKKGIIKNENGVVVKEFSYVADTILHGAYKAFSEQGKIFEESNYVDGELDGQRKIYFDNGAVEIEENYSNGTMNGPYLSYYDNGKVNLEALYENGEMTGVVKRFYRSGTLMEEVSFANNEENGPFKEFYENGSLKWEGNYLNGDNEFGLLLNYSDDGVLVKKMQCDSSAICQTIWTKEKGDIPLKLVFEKD